MLISAIVGSVLSVLLPYVSKGAEAFAKEAGKAAFDKASNLVAALKAKFNTDAEASAALTKFSQNPEQYEADLKAILTKKLTDDTKWAEALSQTLNDMRPELLVIQKMEVGENVVGAKIRKMSRGSAKIDQEIKEGRDILGAAIDEM